MTSAVIFISEISSDSRLWAGRVFSGILTMFMVFDTVMKFLRPPEAIKGTADLGWPMSVVLPHGFVCAVMLVLYLIPRTAVLAAVLFAGYLGGAVAADVRIGNPLFSHTLLPVYVAMFMWRGLCLLDRRVSEMLGVVR